MLPWQAGTTLEYAYEDLTTKDLDERERTRSTSIATVRIPQVLEKDFVQAWSWRDNLYVVEEGDKAEEAAMRKFSAALQDVVLEVQLTRNIQSFNAFSGIDIEPDQNYEARIELPNPVGGPAVPVTLVFSLSVSKDDPDDMYVVFEQTIDRENAGTALSAIAESLFGTKLPSGKDAPEVSIVDEGMFVVHRPTGVAEMFESTRTAALKAKVTALLQ